MANVQYVYNSSTWKRLLSLEILLLVCVCRILCYDLGLGNVMVVSRFLTDGLPKVCKRGELGYSKVTARYASENRADSPLVS